VSRFGRIADRFHSTLAPALPALALILSSVASPARAQDVKLDAETFGGLRARAIGPAAMSGRIAAMDAVEGERLHLFVGAAGGGVWRSKDAGTTFEPVFDKHNQSIGAIAIDRSDHKTIWVGTGESWTRNSTSVGDGIYKSTDGGDNWTHLGLEDSERIAKIAIDPRHPDTVYVAATGHLWNANAMRGVYRTRDGGKTWDRVLFVNEDVGCGDLALDPENPSIVYAGMWKFRRKPWSFASGGPGSGLFKSTDGGTTWKRITAGMPAGDLGRIGIAVAPSKPNVVYAAIEAKRAGIFRSEDRGETWTAVNTGALASPRPFYFGNIYVDPTDHERVYKPGIQLGASDDGAKTFQPIGDGVHSDYHAMWIDPKDSDRILVGTDGGLYESEDRGANWRFFGNLPISQFYHVSFDTERPYNVYGGLQDNGSWVGPSRKSGGIANRHWRVLGGGDGMWSFVDPNDPDITYVEYQEGNMMRVRKSTGETKQIKPFRGPKDPEYRFNWNTPIHMSPTQPGTMYVGAQFLFRSLDRGEKWERISPDLTTNDPTKLQQEQSGGVTVDNSSAENFCTIYSVSESPKNPDVIWVGTDDGNVQVTRNAGKSWELVSKKVAGLPPGYCVSTVMASPHAEGTAYATFDGHGLGDMKPYVFRTIDYGKTWQSIGTADLAGFAHVIRQDPVNANLLFLGTELGLFLSLDGGKQWAPFRGELPKVAVRDIAIQPREGDLILATHGRGIWIVDDILCLRRLTPEVIAAEAAILDTRPSEMVIPSSEQRYEASEFRGESPSEAAFITYYLKKRHMFGDLKLEVYDDQGKLLSTIPAAKRRGINRVVWPMRLKAPKVPPASNLVPNFYAFLGPRVPAGSYTVKLLKGKETYTSKIELIPDPRGSHTAEDRAAQQKSVHELYAMMGDLTYVVDAITDARTQALARAEKLGKDPIAKKLSALAYRFENLRKTLVTTREGRLSGEEQLREKLGSLYGAVNGYDGRPTDSQVVHQQALVHDLDAARATFQTLSKELEGLNTGLATKKLDPVKPLSREEWEKKQAG
jgi:photosystem II stability/assembly factor-like uncharacterized protein